MICPSCSATNPSSARFCANCGNRLATEQPLRGERRIVTVLFADVVGSTAMAERLDPETVTEIMNGAFAFMNDAIERYDGTIARLMGDAIMAFFGAPVAHENDPERTVRAGIDLRDAALEYSRSIRRLHGHDFSVRVGITTGLVVLTTIGNEIHSEYTVMGDTVNTAARLQQTAEPDTVVISQETLRHVQHLFETRLLRPVPLKGKSEPVQAFAVLGERRAPSQARGLAGISSPLVGRDRELAILLNRVEALETGAGGLVTVIGEAGLGKSRLVAEVRNLVCEAQPQGLTWIEGRALSHGSAAPYQPWRELIRMIIDAGIEDPAQVVRRKLRSTLQQLEIDTGVSPFIEAILGAGSEDTTRYLAEMDGNALLDHLRDAATALFAGIAHRQLMVVVLEDLHWADIGTFELLDPITELAETHPILLITLLRPDRNAPSWGLVERAMDERSSAHTELRIEPLDEKHSDALLGNLLYIEDLPATIRDTILAKSDGNPFFLEEVIRSLIDGRQIVRENGRWRATRDIVDVTVPDTLVGVLSARIDRLPSEARTVAQIASVIGRIFAYRVLKDVCQAAPESERIDEPDPHLQLLEAEELIRERVRDPFQEYIFKHVLTQEAAYNLLLVRGRRELHRRTADVLLRVYRDRLEEMSGILAHHFWIAEDWPRALEYSIKAGTWAETQLFALREAHDHFERAYQALKLISDAPDEQVVDVIIAGMATSAKFLPADTLLQRLARAEQIARRLGDKRRLATVLHWTGHVHVTSGYPSRGIPALMENAELASEIGDVRLALYPNWMLAFKMLDSDPATAATYLEDIARSAQVARNEFLLIHGTAAAAIGYARTGAFRRAINLLDHARSMAERATEPSARADFHLLASITFLAMGDLEKAISEAHEGIRRSMESNAMECVGAGFCLVGIGTLYDARPDDALSTFEDSLQFADDYRGDLMVVNQVQAGLAIARYASDQTKTLTEIERARASSESIGDVFTLADISLTLAQAHEGRGERDRADEYMDHAITYYREAGMRPYLQRALKLRARLLESRGDDAEATLVRAEIEQLAREIEELNQEPPAA